MNREKAKEILSLYRPGTADDEDASFREARQWCERDPELRGWFENHCAVYRALRSKFKALPVPEGLKEQILAERKVHTTPMQRRRSVLVAVAASVAIIAAMASLFPRLPSHEDTSFAAYRQRMVGMALRGYGMDVETNDLAAIRSYFQQAPAAMADYSLPEALQRNAQPVGCVLTSWQSKPVTMICFKSGQPLSPGKKSDVWLFVVGRDAVPDAPGSSSPTFAKVNVATAASWASGDKTYVLAVDGDEALLRKFL